MSCVLYESQDGIARITLNRPEARNAINNEVVTELQRAWQRFAAEDDRVAGERHPRSDRQLRRTERVAVGERSGIARKNTKTPVPRNSRDAGVLWRVFTNRRYSWTESTR